MPFTSADAYININATLTPAYMQKNYLQGLVLLGTDESPLGDEFWNEKIKNAIAKVEDFTNVDILPRTIVSEKHDYYLNDYIQYAWLTLFRVPTISVQAVRARYPTGQLAVNFPVEWVKLQGGRSQIQLVPTAGTLSQVLIGQGGDFLPIIYGGVKSLPHLWEIDYTSGMDLTQVPRIVVEAICKWAVMEALQEISDTIVPPGVSSQSLSIDGLSQSRSYALPVFQARIQQYRKDLGIDVPNSHSLLGQIRNTYLGFNVASL